MPLEVTCGHCQGDILVEAAGVTVACPLCGAHVEISDSEAAIEIPVCGGVLPPTDATALMPPTATDPSEEPTLALTADAGDDDWRPLPVEGPDLHAVPDFEPPADAPDFSAAAPLEHTTSLPADALSDVPTVLVANGSALKSAAVAPRSDASSRVSPAGNDGRHASAQATVPFHWFVIAASYASAVTIILLYLFLMRRQHALESLPDLVPQTRGGSVALVVPAPQENVAPGHVLKLGQSERFGSVRVTPVKITRGPIEFDHAFKNSDVTLDPSEPVYKLWLTFENVSHDQVFPPLDRTLVFKRVYVKQGRLRNQRPLTNNFLCAADQRHKEGNLHYVYEMPELSEFVVVGQNLDQDVKPGETWETFIPSEEAIDDLTGECVWRVQFRKGYNARSGRGVTTLIDVVFDAAEVVDEV